MKVELLEKAFSEVSDKILDKEDFILMITSVHEENEETPVNTVIHNNNGSTDDVLKSITDAIAREYDTNTPNFTEGLASIVCPLAIELLSRYSNLNVKFQSELLYARQKYYNKARGIKNDNTLVN